MKRLLIIKLWALGDILMATPMLSAVRHHFPEIHITWVVDRQHAELLANHPGIDTLIALDTGAWRRLRRRGNLFGWARQTHSLRSQMQAGCFDAVINCHPEKWWSWFLCVAPVRVGLYPLTTMPYHQGYTQTIPRVRIHNTEHYLAATTALGCPPDFHSSASRAMTLGETADELSYWTAFRRSHQLSGERPVVVLAPFSTSSNRVWETERLAALSEWLSSVRGTDVILVAGPNDLQKSQEIADLVPGQHSPVMAVGTTLRQYISLIRNADLVICGDSSPMHIAGALGTPYIALFGPTPIKERAPLVGRGVALAKPLPCAPCDSSGCRNLVFRECLKLITVADVQAAVNAML